MKFIGKFSIILGAVFIVSGILSAGLFFASFDWNNLDQSDYFKYLNVTEKVSIKNIDKVSLDFSSEDIEIEKIPGNEFIFNLRGYYPLSESDEYPELKANLFNDVLSVSVEYPQKRYIFGINSRDSNLYVGVPENYNGDFKAETLSGNIKVKNANFDKLELGSVSGDMNIISSSFSEGSFESISGNIDIDNSGNVILVRSVSGDIKTKDSVFKNGNLGSVSGNILVQNSYGMDHFSSTSGDIKVEGFNVNRSMVFESLSGNVKLDLDNESSIDLEFESGSGDLRNNFGKVYGGNYKIIVETTSGDLIIY